MPGRIPRTSPMTTPALSIISRYGSRIINRASPAAFSMLTSMEDPCYLPRHTEAPGADRAPGVWVGSHTIPAGFVRLLAICAQHAMGVGREQFLSGIHKKA